MKTLTFSIVCGLALGTASSQAAALISIVDDGMNTTISWTGGYDAGGLSIYRTYQATFLGTDANFSSDAFFIGAGDIMLFSGASDEQMTMHNGFTVAQSSGWTDPNGDFVNTGASVETTGTASFFFNAGAMIAGFNSTNDGSFLLGGTLADNGFTANESLVFTNPNNGDTITLQTSAPAAVPEPSNAALLGLASLSILLHRKRS